VTTQLQLINIIIIIYQEQDGHKICVKCTNADVRLRAADVGQKDFPKHEES